MWIQDARCQRDRKHAYWYIYYDQDMAGMSGGQHCNNSASVAVLGLALDNSKHSKNVSRATKRIPCPKGGTDLCREC